MRWFCNLNELLAQVIDSILYSADPSILVGVKMWVAECDRCVSILEYTDGDRQVSERANERHQFVIKIVSGPIIVAAVIARIHPVPASLG